MKVRIHEIDIDGTPVAYTGEYYVGANATEIVEAMKKNPFQIDLTVEEYMRKILDKIGKAGLSFRVIAPPLYDCYLAQS